MNVLRTVAQAHEVTPAEIAIAFLLLERSLASVISGATKPEQVKVNLRASDIVLAAEEVALLDAAGALQIDFGASRTAPARKLRQNFL